MSRPNEELLLSYIKEHQEQFYRLAYSYAKNSEDALDIVQDAVVKAIEKQHTLRDPGTIRTWFYRILVNTSIDTLRRRGRVYYTDALPEPEGEPSQEVSPGRSLTSTAGIRTSATKVSVSSRYSRKVTIRQRSPRTGMS